MNGVRWLGVRRGFALCLVLGACPGIGSDPGDPVDAATGAADTTPPAIVSTIPADGAAGVDSTVALSITFSEPMDAFATEAAYTSPAAALAPDTVTLSWSADRKTLFVSPSEPLAYGAGASVATTPAVSYAFTIGTGAQDAAGNALGGPYTVTFTTLRSISETLLCDHFGTVGPAGVQPDDNLDAGSLNGATAEVAYLVYTLPPAVPSELEAALHIEVLTEFGTDPYEVFASTDGGVLVTDQLDRLDPAIPLEDVAQAASLATVTRSMFVADGPRTADVDVAEAVGGAWSSPSAQLLLRISFPTAPTGAIASTRYSQCTEVGVTRLNLDYLVP